MNITIRKALEKDSDAIWEVRSKAIKGISQNFYSKEEVEIWYHNDRPQNFEEVITNLDWLVAFLEDRIIGTGFIDISSAEIGAIFVDPNYQRMRVGRRILDELEIIAKNKRIATLYLDATLSAVDFYKSSGYQCIERSTCQLGNIKLVSQKMKKSIV